MATDLQIAWAAGLFEGEGCINIRRNGATAKSYRTDEFVGLVLRVVMVDADVIRRFHGIVGGNVTGPHVRRSRLQKQPMWSWQATDVVEAVAILRLFLPHLGDRRAAKTIEALQARSDYEMRCTHHNVKRAFA